MLREQAVGVKEESHYDVGTGMIPLQEVLDCRESHRLSNVELVHWKYLAQTPIRRVIVFPKLLIRD